jgi:hypothetical protein
MRIPIVSFLSSVIPSSRLAIYFALGSLLWVAALLSREFIVAAQLYLVVLAFVALLDLVLSPQPKDFEIERHVPDKMNLGTANKVTLEARSSATRMPEAAMPLTLRDEPPLDWPVTVLEGGDPVRAHRESSRTLPVVARLTVRLLRVARRMASTRCTNAARRVALRSDFRSLSHAIGFLAPAVSPCS